MSKLAGLYRLDEMARSREEPMWAVLDWAAQKTGEFTIKDLHRIWAQAGGGGDSASYQQFSTAINNYIYKYDPDSPVPKYRNPRYKYVRVGKTDKGTAPAPLQYVTKGSRGAGGQHVLRWRPGIPPMRQPASGTKKPLAPEGDPVGTALDQLEKKMGRPALKHAMTRWRQLGDLHKISADIMADPQIKGRDKMFALQVAADSLISRGKTTQAKAEKAEDEMADEVSSDGGLFSSDAFGDDDEKTDPDAAPMGASQGESGEEEMPDDLLHGDDDSDTEGEPPPGEEAEAADDGGQADSEDTGEDHGPDDGSIQASLVSDDGRRIPVSISYDEEEGATVSNRQGESFGPYEGFNLEVGNGLLTQEMFDDLEEDGWNLVAAEDGNSGSEPDGSEEEAGAEPEGEEPPTDAEESEDGGSDQAAADDFPAFLPEPDEEGDRSERAMYELVEEGGLDANSPIWAQLKQAKDSIDAHRIIKMSSLPHGLHKSALVVARAIFTNTGRDFDSGKARNESRLSSIYGMTESPLEEPVDFDQKSGLERVFRWSKSG